MVGGGSVVKALTAEKLPPRGRGVELLDQVEIPDELSECVGGGEDATWVGVCGIWPARSSKLEFALIAYG